MIESATLLTGISTLSLAVAFLFKHIANLSKLRLESERERRIESSEMNKRMGLLEGRNDGIENLSKKTLEVVHNALAERNNNEIDG